MFCLVEIWPHIFELVEIITVCRFRYALSDVYSFTKIIKHQCQAMRNHVTRGYLDFLSLSEKERIALCAWLLCEHGREQALNSFSDAGGFPTAAARAARSSRSSTWPNTQTASINTSWRTRSWTKKGFNSESDRIHLTIWLELHELDARVRWGELYARYRLYRSQILQENYIRNMRWERAPSNSPKTSIGKKIISTISTASPTIITHIGLAYGNLIGSRPSFT